MVVTAEIRMVRETRQPLSRLLERMAGCKVSTPCCCASFVIFNRPISFVHHKINFNRLLSCFVSGPVRFFLYSFSNSFRNKDETSFSALFRGTQNATAPSETLAKTFPVLFPLLNSVWATRSSRIFDSVCAACWFWVEGFDVMKE